MLGPQLKIASMVGLSTSTTSVMGSGVTQADIKTAWIRPPPKGCVSFGTTDCSGPAISSPGLLQSIAASASRYNFKAIRLELQAQSINACAEEVSSIPTASVYKAPSIKCAGPMLLSERTYICRSVMGGDLTHLRVMVLRYIF